MTQREVAPRGDIISPPDTSRFVRRHNFVNHLAGVEIPQLEAPGARFQGSQHEVRGPECSHSPDIVIAARVELAQ